MAKNIPTFRLFRNIETSIRSLFDQEHKLPREKHNLPSLRKLRIFRSARHFAFLSADRGRAGPRHDPLSASCVQFLRRSAWAAQCRAIRCLPRGKFASVVEAGHTWLRCIAWWNWCLDRLMCVLTTAMVKAFVYFSTARQFFDTSSRQVYTPLLAALNLAIWMCSADMLSIIFHDQLPTSSTKKWQFSDHD